MWNILLVYSRSSISIYNGDDIFIFMTHKYDENGEKVVYNYTTNQWEYPLDKEYINVHGKKARVCQNCNKPRLDINGVCDVDFCLQGLTGCGFIDNACCGHGNMDDAYISFKDGRRWVLDKEWSPKG